MEQNTLHILPTQNNLTLWWHKPQHAHADAIYQVLVNGTQAAQVSKTHATLNGLQSETAYQVDVYLNGERLVSGIGTTGKAKRQLDVTKAPYHAVGDGQTLNTQALQQAMDDCTAEEYVYLPAGVYKTGALRLHSHMEVYLEEGVVLQGTEEIEDYLPRIPSRFEGKEMLCYSSVLNLGYMDHTTGFNCEDVLIHGHGVIASGGRTLAQKIIEDETELMKDELAAMGDKIKECEMPWTIPARVRPRLINMSNCKNVRISGLTLQNGASWNLHMIYSSGITTDHCTFRSENVWNGDGWDPDSSEDCTLFGCQFFTGDDAVAIKSGKNPEGNVIARPTRRICVFDCHSAFGHGVTIGSEMSGGVEDVYVWDCDLGNAMYGIEIKGTKKRGGYVRNVHLQDCTVARVLMHAVGYNDDGEGADVPPKFSDCSFENLQILGKSLNHERVVSEVPAIELQGFDVPGYEVENVTFTNCSVSRGAEVKMHLCKNISLNLTEID